MDRGKIWINIPDTYDISFITAGLEKYGFSYKRSFVPVGDDTHAVKECEGCIGIIAGMEVWNEKTLSAVKDHIRMIIRYGTGYNNIDVAAATRNGVAIFNAAGRNSAAVAELALIHILNTGRKFSKAIEQAKQNKNEIYDHECFELDNKIVGLYGAGAIARQLARMLSGFTVKILTYDVVENDEMKKLGAQFVKTPEELFKTCDIISIHLPLLESTNGLINKHFLSLMKPNAVLVNTSRGGVINEQDLLETLKEGKIRAVGLDVLRDEPIRNTNPLMQMENAYITPHIAASTYEAKIRVEECLFMTIADFFDGKYETSIPNNYINPPRL